MGTYYILDYLKGPLTQWLRKMLTSIEVWVILLLTDSFNSNCGTEIVNDVKAKEKNLKLIRYYLGTILIFWFTKIN